MNVVGDDKKLLMAGKSARHLFGRRSDVDEERCVVGYQSGRCRADGALLGGRDQSSRLIGNVLDTGGDDSAAMHAAEKMSVTELVEILAYGLRRDVVALCQIIDGDA